MIRLSRPWMGDMEIAAASEVLRSGMLVSGARVAAFEAALAERCGRTHAVAVSSGTAALELALAALAVNGGEVLCPDLSWPSPAHAIVRTGARPLLVDVDPRSWNASARSLSEARTKRCVAAIVIDQFGTPAEHPNIADALGDLPIVVDAACALGASIDGRASASFGRIACLSFHPRKVITTGEGGACLTDDAALADELRTMRNHGQFSPGRFVSAAGNFRMTEVAAAIGLAQLGRLDAILERRAALAARYREALAHLGVQSPPLGGVSNWQTFGVMVPASVDRDALIAKLREDGIETGRLSYALHRLASVAPSALGGPFPNAERLDDRGLALPLHPMMEHADVDRVIDALGAGIAR